MLGASYVNLRTAEPRLRRYQIMRSVKGRYLHENLSASHPHIIQHEI
ncbi:hypothetical protein [Campylobacter curvus]|nr:hypothetical protein [Campylobacter curvus]EJP76139.1 hypothetical protein HMPREF1139_1810 [Campylobacter sp. FOBRC14]